MEREKTSPIRKRMANSDTNQSSAKRQLDHNAELLEAVDSGEHLKVCTILKSYSISKGTLNAALSQASEMGRKQIMQLLIDHGGNINVKNSSGNTSLMTAAEHGYFDIVKMLVQRGASVHYQNKSGKTALMLAAEKACSVPLLTFLISSKAKTDVNCQDKKGKTALMIATELCDFYAMEILMCYKGTDLSLKDKKGNTVLDIAKINGVEREFNALKLCSTSKHFITPIMLAVQQNDADLLKSFLYGCSNVDLINENGSTALILALKRTEEGRREINLQIVTLLLNAGACVNVVDSKTASTPLMFAVVRGHTEVTRLLIEHGAEINFQRTTDKYAALMIAAVYGWFDIAEQLINGRADLDKLNNCGESALILALKHEKYDLAKLLLGKGAKSSEQTYRLAIERGQHWLYPTVSEDIVSPLVLQELFLYAINKNDLDLAVYFLDNGADVNDKGKHGFSPLSLAVPNKDMVQLLLDHGARVDDRNGTSGDHDGETALMKAVLCDNADVVQLLIEKGADINLDFKGFTALNMALNLTEKGRQALRTLLEGGANVNYVPCNAKLGETPLLFTLTLKDLYSIELLLNYGADVEATDKNGYTVLMKAARDFPSAVLLLLRKGADVNRQAPNGTTALMIATSFLKIDSIFYLLNSKANVNMTNDRGETAFMIAVRYHTTDIFKLFLQHGADINATDISGSTILLHAVAHSILKTDGIRLLIEKAADVNRTNHEGLSPLMVGAQKCNASILSCLIENGANVNAQDVFGLTALMHAANSPDVSIEKIEVLINGRADVNIQNLQGYSALMLAVIKGNCRAVSGLLREGADVHAVERETQQNALSFAMKKVNHCNCYPPHFSYCLKQLLRAGAKPIMSKRTALFFYELIEHDKRSFVQLFVCSGLAPPEIPGSSFYRNLTYSSIPTCSSVTPLTVAIKFRNLDIAEFFIKNWYLTKQDFHLSRSYLVKQVLRDIKTLNINKYNMLQNFLFNPWSLSCLSFVVISAAVGNNGDREQRIRSLPIPNVLQEKLLFRNNNMVFYEKDQDDVCRYLVGVDYQD